MAGAVQGQFQERLQQVLVSEEEPPTDEVLCNEARQKVRLLDMCFALGIATKLPPMLQAGQCETP